MELISIMRQTLAWKPMPQFLLTIGVIVGDLLFSNLNTWIWQCKAWCQRWQGQDIVQKQLAGMYKLWFLTVFSININTAAPPPSHQPRLLQAHLSSLRNMCNLACKRGKLQQKVSCIQYPSIHPSIHLLSDRRIRRGLSSCNYERVFILMSPELGASCGHCYFGFILYLFEPLKIMRGKIFEFHYHSHSVKYESQI